MEREKVTTKQKAKVVYELRHSFPVKQLLKVAGIPRSTYYYWTTAFNRPDKNAKWKDLITSIFKKHKGRYGYRRVYLELRNSGHHINHKKVQRIMKDLGLKCLVRPKKYRSYKGDVGETAPNILNRQFKATKANEKWVTDLTEFKLFSKKYYLSPVLDLFNGEIISFTIGNRPTSSLVSNMLDKAFKYLPKGDKPLMHSDQGWHYRMKQYRYALEQQGIKQSMSRKGNCYDNAVIENFFGIIKSEFIFYETFNNEQHFLQELEKYITYYNEERIKEKLNGMSPVEYRTHCQQTA